jgi:molybdopterin-biosynthesis enzyme MoeA-like protein
MQAEIVVIGTELLLGQIIDTRKGMKIKRWEQRG